MADNYLQYSTQYNFPREITEEERKELIRKIAEAGVLTRAENYGEDVDEEIPFEVQYAGTEYEIEKKYRLVLC